MKPHLPVPLLAVVVAAITAPCVLAAAPYADAVYTAAAVTTDGGRSTGSATIASRTPEDAPNSSSLNLSNYTGTLSIVGSATGDQNITEQVGSTAAAGNGGYGGRFALTNPTSATPNLTVKISGGTEINMGTVLQDSATAPQIEANNASFFTGSSTIAANIKVEAGGLRLNGGSSTSYTFSGTITGSGTLATSVGGSGITTFTGDVSGFRGTWLNPANGRLFVFGNGTAACAGGSVGGTFGRANSRLLMKFNYSGDYSIAGDVHASTLTIASGNATFGGTVDATTVSVTAGASFSLSETGVYALNGKTVTALTVGGNGAISLSGANTFNGTLTANGSQISIADGASFTTGALASLTKVATNEIYVDSVSETSGNGYSSGLRYVLVADNAVNTDQTFGSSTTGALTGTTIKLVAGTGLVAETTGTYGEYFINSGTVVYGSSDNSAASGSTTKLILAGGTLQLNTDLKTNLASSGGTINVSGGVTLLASKMTASAATTLTGSGTYRVSGDTLSSNNNISLAEGENGWTGIVNLVSSSAGRAWTFSNLVNGSYSYVGLTGINGWSNNWAGTEASNFYLENGSSSVAWTNGATATTRQTCTFTGKFKGTGTFKMTGENQNYTFTGDISEWTGQFIKDTTGNNTLRTTFLTFQGNATDVNIGISLANKSTLAVVANVDGVTFHKDIANVTSLQVNNGFTSTLEGTATVGTLTLNAGATATLSGDGKVALGTTAAPGRLSFEVLDKNAPAVATLAEGETAETPTPAATGSISNGGSAAVSFSNTAAGSADTTYSNIKIKANSSADFALLGTLDNSAVENNNTGAVTVNAPGAGGGIAGLYANKGDIIVSTTALQEAVSVGVLSVAQGTSVSVTGTDSTGVGTLEAGNVMTVTNADAASATASLTANLVVSDGATLTLPTALDLGGNALTFSGNIGSLDTTYTDELRALLFSNADSVTFGTDTYDVASDGAITLNGSLVADQDNGVLLNGSVVGLDGDILLNVVGDGTSGLINVTYSVPEPATATLGLLALAGLCLRRRRK